MEGIRSNEPLYKEENQTKINKQRFQGNGKLVIEALTALQEVN